MEQKMEKLNRYFEEKIAGCEQRDRRLQGKVLKLRGVQAVRPGRGTAEEHHSGQDKGEQALHGVPSFRSGR